MKSQPKVSVIIPVYNTEKYLRQCLDSVVNQTLSDIEIICVDDGSTDSSLEILREYEARDPRFRVLTQPNLYAGAARNKGLDCAAGKYIAFLDADDFLELDAYERMLSVAESFEAEVVKTSAYCFDNNTNRELARAHFTPPDEKYRNRIISFSEEPEVVTVVNVVPWTGLYDRRFLQRNQIRFCNLVCVNDRSFTSNVMIHAKRLVLIPDKPIHYRECLTDSLVGKRAKNFGCEFESYRIVEKQCAGLNDYQKAVVLSNEFADVFGWYRLLKKGECAETIRAGMHDFLRTVDVGLFTQNLTQISWLDSYKTEVEELVQQAREEKTYWATKLKNASYRRDLKPHSPDAAASDAYREGNAPDTNLHNAEALGEYQASDGVKVSVIIPVYNAEAYLCQCLDTVIGQTLKEIEILCMDDGSTDNSLEILHRYGEADKRIKILQQPNQGPAIARNKCIDIASGEFIAFMDSDDVYLEDDILERMFLAADRNGAKICGGEVSVLNDDKIVRTSNYFPCEGMMEYRDFQADYGYQRYIFSKELLDTNGIRFPNYLRFEDPVFMARAMVAAGKFYALDEVTYGYRFGHQNVNWTFRKANDLANGLLDNLRLSKEHQLSILHETCVKRINGEYEKAFAKSLNEGNEELLCLLAQINSEIDPALLPPEMIKGNGHYLILPLKKLLLKKAEGGSGSAQPIGGVSYRIGRAITWLPRKLRGGVRCIREHGLKYTCCYALKKLFR